MQSDLHRELWLPCLENGSNRRSAPGRKPPFVNGSRLIAGQVVTVRYVPPPPCRQRQVVPVEESSGVLDAGKGLAALPSVGHCERARGITN